MQKTPEAVDISEEQYSQLLIRVEGKNLSDEDWKWILRIMRAYGLVAAALRNQKITIQKLKKLIFGKKTEKHKPENPVPNVSPGDPGFVLGDELGPALDNPPIPIKSMSLGEATQTTSPKEDDATAAAPHKVDPKKKKPPGHGRRSGDSWDNAEIIFHPHQVLTPGCPCPSCKTGRLYPFNEPAVWVRFIGRPPLVAEVNHLERLRCNPCGELFTASAPKDLIENPTSTPEARATAAILKYQAATPFNRFADIEKSFGHPIPRTRIWTLCSELALCAQPVVLALLDFAAQGWLVQNDDTTVKILQLIKENKIAEEAGVTLKRKGMFTTAIVSKVGERKVILFFSSRQHAGENLDNLLALRDPALPPATQICDASSMNTTPGKHATEVGGCHDHARRGFFDIKESFPRSCGHALAEWKLIYETDALAKKQHLNAEERLLLHQEHSAPVMERLKVWCRQMIDEKRVEPNGHLAGAMQYFLDHYVKLTLFLRKSGVPLSNCECEQALKTAIGVRKMAYFFKTINGAKVADIIFTLIATCKAAGIGLYDYLVALQRNEGKVAKAPELWFPWNYHLQVKGC
jgi:transposase